MTETHAVPGDGTWWFAVAQRADTKLTDLINALHEPSVKTTQGVEVVCTAVGLQLPAFGLVGADGTVVRPQLPVTVCGMPLPDVLHAFNSLPWKTESETKTTRQSTTATLPSRPPAGCPSQTEYLIGWPVGESAEPWSRVRHPPMPPITLACEYRIDYGSTPEPVGTVISGTTLTPDQARKIQGAVDVASLPAATPLPTAPPYFTASLGDCPQSVHADRFVALGGPNDLPYLAELGGCSRLRFPNGYLAQVSPDLTDLLAAVGIS